VCFKQLSLPMLLLKNIKTKASKLSIEQLYQKLVEAYSDTNLNSISSKLIQFYKHKNHEAIRSIAHKISKYVAIDEEKYAKCFSKLIMLYHPDKGELYRKELKMLYLHNNIKGLTSYSHILQLKNIEYTFIAPILTNVDFQSEEVWEDVSKEGYYCYEEGTNPTEEFEKSFYNEVKFRQYGDLSVNFPPYYLEDFEEFELSACEIEILDGIEHCKHTKIFDLSHNKITNIEEISSLIAIEELYLANNQIGYIDALSNLPNLKIIDLSHNQIDDIEPLLTLENLEYVNVIGNKVPDQQIKILRAKKNIVMH